MIYQLMCLVDAMEDSIRAGNSFLEANTPVSRPGDQDAIYGEMRWVSAQIEWNKNKINRAFAIDPKNHSLYVDASGQLTLLNHGLGMYADYLWDNWFEVRRK